MSRVTTVLMLVGVLFLIPVVAQATAIPLIQNQTTGAVIFQDGFEGDTVGSAPTTAAIGTWGAPVVSGGNTIAVIDSMTAGFPAYEGDKFLKLNAATTSSCTITGTGVAANSGAGNIIQTQFAFRNASGSGLVIRPLDASGSRFMQLALIGPTAYSGALTANCVAYDNGSGYWILTSLMSTPNDWNELSVTHTNGVNTWAISLNSETSVTVSGFTGMDASNWSGLNVKTIGTGVSYFDAVVPEPSSLALLASGLIGLLCYAWRKRR